MSHQFKFGPVKKALLGASASIIAACSLVGVSLAATTTVTVTPSDLHNWSLNGDPSTSTPYEFSEDQASLGEGSIYVQPIGSNAANKFIAALPLAIPTSVLNSVAYDFMIAGNGDAADANQFYLNIYTNLPNSSTFYDCRFDYVPTTGSTSSFTTALFESGSTPTNVAARPNVTCPTTLSGMTDGSTVKFIAINVGDTSTSDIGLAGYLDKAVVTTATDVTTYDFEQNPVMLANKDQCKNGGWKTSDYPVFKNQGDCVSSFASEGKAGGNPIVNFFRNLFN